MYQYRSVKRYDATYKRYVIDYSRTFFIVLSEVLYEQMISNLRLLSETKGGDAYA